MPTVKRFEDLEIWQLARALARKVFEQTQQGKLSRDYKLSDQMNSSSGSSMDNIAEGFGRGSRLEFVQFLSIARGSAAELQSQFYRCLDRGYMDKTVFDPLYSDADVLCRKITAFMDYLNQSDVKGVKFSNRKTVR